MFHKLGRPAFLLAIFLFLLAFVPRTAYAIAPPYVSDQELAECPVIVVAKWNGAPWKDNSLVEKNILTEHEVATEIEVSRVIKGDLKPGKHTVLVGFRIGWLKEDGRVMSFMSTEVLGDAEATKDNLWFLVARPSRVDQKPHWSLDTYRGVQPLALERFYMALQDKDFSKHVPGLLKSDDELTPLRTLKLIAGSHAPWPYELPSYMKPRKQGPLLKDQADRVRALVEESRNKNVRREALAVYAQLTGKAGVPFMQANLTDEDPEVRAIALGTLALFKERSAPEDMAKAVVGFENAGVSCELIKRLNEWGDVSTVPALIELLQDDSWAGRAGNDWFVPALKARAALFKITSHWFPFDVEAGRKAWATAKEIQDPFKRAAELAHIIPGDPEPWGAKVVVENERAFVEVTNRSKHPLTLASRPSDITLSYANGLRGMGTRHDTDSGKEGFVELNPGKSHRFELDIDAKADLKFFTKGDVSLDMAYVSGGRKSGVKAWMGIISIGSR